MDAQNWRDPNPTPPPFNGGLCAPITVQKQHQTFDRKVHCATQQHYESHVGIMPDTQDETLKNAFTVAMPYSKQSVVTTTTVVTTTITSNVQVHPGDVFTGNQPWVSTSSRTDVQESTTVASQSSSFSIGNSNAMDVTMPPALGDQPILPDSPLQPQRRGVRRHFGDVGQLPPSAVQNTRKTRRTSTPATVGNGDRPNATISAIIAPISTLTQTNQTPTCLLRLSSTPKPSDLIIVRILGPGMEELGEHLTTVAPKHATTAAGEILVSPSPLPPSFTSANVPLTECRISFHWLSGDRIHASLISDCLSTGSSSGEPSPKRPKLE